MNYQKQYREVIFDTETKKFFDETGGNDPGELGLSIVSVYTRTLNQDFVEIQGKMQSFWENELEGLWELFQKCDRIIGFNSLKFDVPVLQPYTSLPLANLPHLDILLHIKQAFGRRISLDAVAKDTLGEEKSDQGAKAVLYWKKGDRVSLEKLKKYCEQDVFLTKRVYDYGLKNKQLKFTDHWNDPRTINIDFSYREIPDKSTQAQLFL